MRERYTIKQIGDAHYDELRPWNFVGLHNTICDRLAWFLVNFTKITPNQVTLLGFFCIVISAIMFFTNHLVLGAIFFYLRWVWDTTDGRIARVKNATSNFGGFLDNYVGQIGIPFCMLGVAYSQYMLSKNLIWFVVVFLYFIFWSLHALESMKVSNILGATALDLKMIKKEKPGIFNLVFGSFINFLCKHRLEEPLNFADMNILLFVISPIVSIFTGHLLGMWIFVVIVCIFKIPFWFLYYYKTLSATDRKSVNK